MDDEKALIALIEASQQPDLRLLDNLINESEEVCIYS